MTDKLYYESSHRKDFEAQVISCEPEGEGYKVVLDKTVFFPEGGGQYADTGILGGVHVLDAQEKDGIIYHYTDGALTPGETHRLQEFEYRNSLPDKGRVERSDLQK